MANCSGCYRAGFRRARYNPSRNNLFIIHLERTPMSTKPATSKYIPQVGDLVGAQRWPNRGNHPDCWGLPWKGLVLDPRDPRAWANTIAFPVAEPDPVAVRRHVDACVLQGYPPSIPVLWDFGAAGLTTYWSAAEHLRPFDEDYQAWLVARANAHTAFAAEVGAVARKAALREHLRDAVSGSRAWMIRFRTPLRENRPARPGDPSGWPAAQEQMAVLQGCA